MIFKEMYKGFVTLTVIASLLIVGSGLYLYFSRQRESQAETTITDKDKKTCLEKIEVHGIQWPPPQYATDIEIVKAVKIKTDFLPVKGLEKYRMGGQPLMWLTPDRKSFVLDENYFSDLKRADLVSINTSEPVAIGQYLGINRPGSLALRELVKFLIESTIILTFAHVGSEFCLIKEIENKKEYRAFFYGKHIYYTNERNEQYYGFNVTINKKSGAIKVQSS